jgi:hypothetical protein
MPPMSHRHTASRHIGVADCLQLLHAMVAAIGTGDGFSKGRDFND